MNLALVLNQRGQQRITKVALGPDSPVTIGRGWQNDVIVDDEYVDGAHARLQVSEGGQLTLLDLNSENGTQIGGKAIASPVVLASGASVTLGDTTIVVHDTAVSVAPPIRRNSFRVFFNRFNSIGGVLAATVFVVLALLMSTYTLEGVAATGGRLLSTFLGAGTLLFLWSLIAALVGKLFRNETNAPLHWVFISTVMAVVLLTTFVVDVFKFNLDSVTASSVIDNVLTGALIAVVSFVMFTLCTRLSSGKRLVAVCILAFLPIGYNLVQPALIEKHEAWSYWAHVEELSHPPAFLFRQPSTLDAHLQATVELFVALDDELKSDSSGPTFKSNEVDGESFKMSIID